MRLILRVIISMMCLFGASEALAYKKDMVAPLVADISSPLIEVNTRFSGAKLLLFGAIDGDGEVAVVVRGPFDDVIVRKKNQIAGIWVNGEGVKFKASPSFYHVAATEDLKNIATDKVLNQLQIGDDNLYLMAKGKKKKIKEFTKAFKDLKIRENLYSSEVGAVKLLGNKLFRTDISFPSNAPIGDYLVEVYLFKNKQLVSMEITPLKILKTGIEAEIHNFANKYSFLYGVLAVLIACLFGFCASVVFQKA